MLLQKYLRRSQKAVYSMPLMILVESKSIFQKGPTNLPPYLPPFNYLHQAYPRLTKIWGLSQYRRIPPRNYPCIHSPSSTSYPTDLRVGWGLGLKYLRLKSLVVHVLQGCFTSFENEHPLACNASSMIMPTNVTAKACLYDGGFSSGMGFIMVCHNNFNHSLRMSFFCPVWFEAHLPKHVVFLRGLPMFFSVPLGCQRQHRK